MRYAGKRKWLYRRDITRFARSYASSYALAPPGQGEMTGEHVVSSVRALALRYKTDDRTVAADVLAEFNRILDGIRLGPGGVPPPRLKTPDELLADGHPELIAEQYPQGGTVEELLVLDDDSEEET